MRREERGEDRGKKRKERKGEDRGKKWKERKEWKGEDREGKKEECGGKLRDRKEEGGIGRERKEGRGNGIERKEGIGIRKEGKKEKKVQLGESFEQENGQLAVVGAVGTTLDQGFVLATMNYEGGIRYLDVVEFDLMASRYLVFRKDSHSFGTHLIPYTVLDGSRLRGLRSDIAGGFTGHTELQDHYETDT